MSYVTRLTARAAGLVLVGVLGLVNAASAQNTSDYVPLVQRGFSDYRNIYAPTSASIGRGGGEITLATTHGDFSIARAKIFIPPGTKGFSVSWQPFFSPQDSRAVARFRAIPTVTSGIDVSPSTAITDSTLTLSRLVAGEELRFYGPPSSGGMSVSNYASGSTFRAAQGGYVYFNMLQIPEGRLISLQTTIIVDEACYLSWHANASWDAQGNPVDSATHTCTGSSGGTTTPPVTTPPTTGTATLTGITVSNTNLNAGGAASDKTFTIQPVPSNATLPSNLTCTASNTSIVQANLLSLGFTLNANADNLVSATTFTVTCGSFTSPTITVTPRGGSATVATTVVTGTDNRITLRTTLTLGTAQRAAGNSVNFWVAAKIPRNALFFTDDLWFFRTATGWGTINGLDIYSATFRRSVAVPADGVITVEVPLGFTQNELRPFQVELHMGYSLDTTTVNGAFINLGRQWTSVN
jgi:hypothetical protein